MLKSKQLKKYWRGLGVKESFKAFLRNEAERASEYADYRAEGKTFPDAAFLLLERKRASFRVEP
jgi:hypothetical protein